MSGNPRSSSCHATGDGTQGHAGSPGAPLTSSTSLSSLRLLVYGICGRQKTTGCFFSSGLCERPHGAVVCGPGSSKSQVFGSWYSHTEERAKEARRLVRHSLDSLPWLLCACAPRVTTSSATDTPSSPLPLQVPSLVSGGKSLVTSLSTLLALPLGF